MEWWLYPLASGVALVVALRVYRRLQLSLAKPRTLRGHARMSRRVARLLPFFGYGPERFFRADDAPPEVEARRREAFERVSNELRERAPRTLRLGEELAQGVSDVDFTNAYRVPFPFRAIASAELPVGVVLERTSGPRMTDLDGNESYDLTGAYGVNVLGYEAYKGCIDRAVERARALGPVLGPYHPTIADNVRRLKAISGRDEVSFHMSGTEAVMQAVRLARYHTRRSHVVVFSGSYHGWWDGVQPGVGNQRRTRDVYILEEQSARTLRLLRTRRDVACVLVNPLQALNPNGGSQSDALLVASDRKAGYDREAYAAWLHELREVCTERGIVLIFDEVFLGFRLAPGGAQEYFGVRADLVTYGKTLGGGLPVGVVCGPHRLMKRYRDDRPTDVCFARGTFNSHPYVMTAMNEFLLRLDEPEVRALYADLDVRWDARAAALNARLEAEGLPVRVANMTSIFTVLYTQPARYNWMFQYYLRLTGLTLGWIGTARLIFSYDYRDEDVAEVFDRFVAAARSMEADGWWWRDPALTNADIKRQMLRELLAAAWGRRGGTPLPEAPQAPAPLGELAGARRPAPDA